MTDNQKEERPVKTLDEVSVYRVIAAPKNAEKASKAFVIEFPATRSTAIDLARALLFSYNIKWSEAKSVLEVHDTETAQWIRVRGDHSSGSEYDMSIVNLDEVESVLTASRDGDVHDDPWVPLEQKTPDTCGADGFESTFEV